MPRPTLGRRRNCEWFCLRFRYGGGSLEGPAPDERAVDQNTDLIRNIGVIRPQNLPQIGPEIPQLES